MAEAVQIVGKTISVKASGDLAYINRFVNMDSSGELAYCGAGEKSLGVILDKADDGEMANCMIDGIARVYSAATLTYGDEVISNASGQAIKHVADSTIVNKAADEAKSVRYNLCR
jgi:hypothetical protein